MYLNIIQISVDGSQRLKNLKNRWEQTFFDRIKQADNKQGYQEDISRLSRACSPDIPDNDINRISAGYHGLS